MLYPIGGQGLRPKISLEPYFYNVLDNFCLIKIGAIEIPLGLLAFYGLICFFLYLFFRTKVGRATIATGENEAFSRLSGIDIARIRLIAVILSTILAGIGVCVYSQSYGFIQLYDEPLSMYFPAISAVLIGGSTGLLVEPRIPICPVSITVLLQGVERTVLPLQLPIVF
jgi:simple sugar transport system permease protein